jgi:hypothetical protein
VRSLIALKCLDYGPDSNAEFASTLSSVRACAREAIHFRAGATTFRRIDVSRTADDSTGVGIRQGDDGMMLSLLSVADFRVTVEG